MTTTTNWEKDFDDENFCPNEGSQSAMEEVKDFIRTLLAKQREELLDQAIKAISSLKMDNCQHGGDCSGFEVEHSWQLDGHNIALEMATAKLSALRLEGGGK